MFIYPLKFLKKRERLGNIIELQSQIIYIKRSRPHHQQLQFGELNAKALRGKTKSYTAICTFLTDSQIGIEPSLKSYMLRLKDYRLHEAQNQYRLRRPLARRKSPVLQQSK